LIGTAANVEIGASKQKPFTLCSAAAKSGVFSVGNVKETVTKTSEANNPNKL